MHLLSLIIARMFTFLQIEFHDNSTGTVINTIILHDENTLLMVGIHILGELYFYCLHIFYFLWNRILHHQNNEDPHCCE